MDTVLLNSAVSFGCSYLKIDSDFTLEFVSTNRHQHGFCDYYEDEIVITIAKRLSPENIIRTLFHEMVHLKQYTDGRLEAGSPLIWFGSAIVDSYENLPWEIEAFEIEDIMMKSFYG